LAQFHSVVLWLTYELACKVSPSESPKERFFFGVCVTVLAFMNPILIQQIGSSFSDITTAGLVLGGWLLLANAIHRPRTKLVILAGILLGLSAALKPTNIVHAFAAFLVVAFIPVLLLARIRLLLYFGAALGASFAFAAAPWSYRLAGMFGNPMFPLLNNVFKSPELTTAPLRTYRFIPDSLTDALMRPFAISGTGPMIQEELSAPDSRYVLLLLIFLIFVSACVWRYLAGTPTRIAAPRSESATRVLAALGCGFVVDWMVWLIGSGNGRYFIPMACIAAVLAVALLFRLLVNHPVGRNGILLALFIAQGTQLVIGTDYRWNPAPWDGHWFNVDIPAKLTTEPNLYLSIGGPSNSFLVPFLPKGSGFVTFTGEFDLGPYGGSASRVRALIARSTPNVRVLVSGEGIYEDAAKREPRQSDVDDVLRAFDLRVDMSDCATITIRGLRLNTWRAPNSSIPARRTPRGKLRYTSHLASCHVIPDTRDESQELAARHTVDLVLDRLEDACPALFQPPRPQTEHVNQIWLRRYGATDLTAWVGNGEVNFIDAVRNPHEISVGSEEAWIRGPLQLECGRQHGIYFGRLKQGGS
jgi:hypothetical protein